MVMHTKTALVRCVMGPAIMLAASTAALANSDEGADDRGPGEIDNRRVRLQAMLDERFEVPPEEPESVTGADWIYESADPNFITSAHVDVLGNLIVTGTLDSEAVATIESYDVSPLSTAPSAPQWVQATDGIPTATASTLDGELFVALIGFTDDPGTPDEESVFVEKRLVSTGERIPGFFAEFSAAVDDYFPQIELTPDGAPIVGWQSVESGGIKIVRLDPFTGIQAWVYESHRAPPEIEDFSGERKFLRVGPSGDVYLLESEVAGGEESLLLIKISGSSGRELWPAPVEVLPPTDHDWVNPVLMIGRDGSVVVVGGSDSDPFSDSELNVKKVNPDGDVVWSYATTAVPTGFGSDAGIIQLVTAATMDVNDDVYVLFYDNDPGVLKLSGQAPSSGASKQPEWVTFERSGDTGLTDSTSQIVAGPSDNGIYAYSARMVPGSASFSERQDWFARLNRDTGTLVPNTGNFSEGGWEFTTGEFTTPGDRFLAHRVVADGGGNVYFIGSYPIVSDFRRRLRIHKVRQPSPTTPIEVLACPSFVVEDRSIWAPGVGLLSVENEYDVLPNAVKNIEFTFGGRINTFLLGTWGAGIDFDFFVDPRLGYRAEIDGGSVDVHLPVDIEWTIPPMVTIQPDQTVTIVSDYEVDPAARLTSCFKPKVDAGVTGSFTGSAEIDTFGEAGVFGTLWNEELLNESANVSQTYLPFLSIGWWLDFLGFSLDGRWNEYEDALFRMKFRSPQLEAQAGYNSAQQSFTARPSSVLGEPTNRFFVASANITEIFMTLVNSPIPTSLSFTICVERLCLSLSAAVFQFFLDMNVDLAQEITVDQVAPWVRYEFSDGRAPVLLRVGDDLTFTMPSQGTLPSGRPKAAEVIVTPTVFVRSRMSNETSVDFVPGYTFESLSVGASANYRSWELFSESTKLGVFQDDFGSIGGLTLFPNGVFPGSWALDMPAGVNASTGDRGIRLPPFIVTARLEGQPTLIGASRGKLDMFIYDQTSPSVGEFNGVANRTSKMLIYGRDFYPVDDPDPELRPRVMISHQGRAEQLPFTRINFETILVEVPNRFRVVPGVARIWVANDIGCSETIDLPIEFPVPLLDAVNPNLWAADPELGTIPIQVIDRKALLGANTFITRRDYYIKLRDDLWNTSIADGVSANEYFPDFNFNQLPQFPAVYFGGMPLARFAQPVDNGIYNLRLSEANFDRPRCVPVFICNPGPGGGVSETLDLTIAAPLPVLARMEPDRIEPGGLELPFTDDGTFTMIVRGPEHVPTFGGFEEPKYGNFNADTVVYFDGEYDAATNSMIGGFALATEYIDSSELRVDVPIQLVQHPGSHHVRVFTPDNGTEYFEELWTDADFDGVPDRFTDDDGDGVPDDLVFQGFLPSGGASAPLLLRVEYEAPIIHMLSQVESVQNNPVFDTTGPDNVPYYNLSVIGEYFRDGAVVLVDGEPRDTEFVSREMVRCHMIAEDVAIPGVRRIVVQNPGADGDQTEALEFLVTPASSRVPQLHARSP